jgi:hypothetical protein
MLASRLSVITGRGMVLTLLVVSAGWDLRLGAQRQFLPGLDFVIGNWPAEKWWHCETSVFPAVRRHGLYDERLRLDRVDVWHGALLRGSSRPAHARRPVRLPRLDLPAGADSDGARGHPVALRPVRVAVRCGLPVSTSYEP